MWPEDLRGLKKVRQCFEDGLDQILLLDIDRVQDERDQLRVLPEDFDCIASLSQVVHSDHGQSLQTLVT